MSSGFLNDLNEVQRKALDSVKSKLDEEKNEIRKQLELQDATTLSIWTVSLEADSANRDIVLLKFLRARDFKIDIAYEMLIKCLKWRKDFKVDGILDEKFPEYYDRIGEIYRTDKDNRPVMYNYYCNIDIEKTFQDGVSQFLRWKVAQMERAVQMLAYDAGGWKPYARESLVVVHDYKDVSLFGMDKRTKQASKETIALLQDNYPEMLAQKFFINVPWFFEKMYDFFTSFSNERTRKKFIVCSNKTYRKQLLQFIDADSLPQRYGGINPELSSTSSKVESVTLKPKDNYRIDLGELQSDQLIEWEYIVETMDIGFGILKQKKQDQSDTTTTTTNSDTFVVPISQHEFNAGSYRVEENGHYFAVFDNNYSMFNKKVVHYSVKPRKDNPNSESTPTATTTTTTTTTTTIENENKPVVVETEETTKETTTTANTSSNEENNENKENENTTTTTTNTTTEPTSEEPIPTATSEEQIDE